MLSQLVISLHAPANGEHEIVLSNIFQGSPANVYQLINLKIITAIFLRPTVNKNPFSSSPLYFFWAQVPLGEAQVYLSSLQYP